MATYICLIDYTEEGVRMIKGSPKRLDAAKALARRLKGRIREFFLTLGAHDVVCVLQFPDDRAAAKFALKVASAGYVRTTTLRAFPEAEYRKIVSGLPK